MTPEQQVEYINRQDRMNRIKKVAEMYANATPEQRAKVDASTVKSLINEYRELQEMQRQAEDMEQRAQLEAMRAQEEAQRATAQGVGGGRRIATPTNTPETITPTPETITAGPQGYTYEEGGTIWYVDPNGNEIAVGGLYPGYGKTPYEEQVVTNNGVLPAYDPRYDVNSDQYVYNKTTTGWRTQPLPEFADSYHMYDNAGNLRGEQYKDYLENRIMGNPTVGDVAMAVGTMVPAYGVSSAVNASNLAKGVNAAADNAVVANNAAKSLQYAQAVQRAANRPLQVRNTVTNARNALVPVSEGRLYNPTYGNQYSAWAQDYLDTVNKTKNLAKGFNTSGYIPRSRAISPVSQGNITYSSIPGYTAQQAANYTNKLITQPALSNTVQSNIGYANNALSNINRNIISQNAANPAILKTLINK